VISVGLALADWPTGVESAAGAIVILERAIVEAGKARRAEMSFFWNGRVPEPCTFLWHTPR